MDTTEARITHAQSTGMDRYAAERFVRDTEHLRRDRPLEWSPETQARIEHGEAMARAYDAMCAAAFASDGSYERARDRFRALATGGEA